MAQTRMLPTSKLAKNYCSFLDAWEVNRKGVFVPPIGELEPVYLWTGKFSRGETVAIVADEQASREILRANLYVGIVDERDYVACTTMDEKLVCQADTAMNVASGGLRSAIKLLNVMRGMPDGTRLDLTTY
jgi:hypothetical protein